MQFLCIANSMLNLRKLETVSRLESADWIAEVRDVSRYDNLIQRIAEQLVCPNQRT